MSPLKKLLQRSPDTKRSHSSPQHQDPKMEAYDDKKTDANVLPPPYIENSAGSDEPRPTVNNIQCSGGHIYLFLLQDISTPMYMGAVVNLAFKDRVPWHAELRVEVGDIPALMQQGLYWSEKDVIKEAGFFTWEPEWLASYYRRLGWAHYRHYQIEHSGPGPQWKGRVRVYARCISVLSRFKLSDLSVANIRFASAWKKDGRQLYKFDSAMPHRNINALYDDMPMKGWWPWPKGQKEETG